MGWTGVHIDKNGSGYSDIRSDLLRYQLQLAVEHVVRRDFRMAELAQLSCSCLCPSGVGWRRSPCNGADEFGERLLSQDADEENGPDARWAVLPRRFHNGIEPLLR